MTPGNHNVGWRAHQFNVINVRWRTSKRDTSDVTVQVSHGSGYGPASMFLNYNFYGKNGPQEVPFSKTINPSDWFAEGAIKYRPASGQAYELSIDLIDGPPREQFENFILHPGKPNGPPPPPEEPGYPEDPPLVDVVVEGVRHHDLFPYVYVRPWPKVTSEDLENRFVAYKGPAPAGSLLAELARLKEQGDRSGMEQAAIDYINGTAQSPPSHEGFIGKLSDLQGLIKYFASFDDCLRRPPPGECIELPQLELEIGSCLADASGNPSLGWNNVQSYVDERGSPPGSYSEEKDRVWQSLFALNVLPGYLPGLLDDLSKTLVIASLIERVVALGNRNADTGEGDRSNGE